MESLRHSFGLRSRLGLGLAALVLFACACGAVADESEKPSSPASTPPSSTSETTPGNPSADPPAATAVACDHPVRTEEDARDGTVPAVLAHEKACTFTDYDGVGVVMKIVRTVDASKRFVTENMDRLDDPPRDTDHDGVYGVSPRRTRALFQNDGVGRVTNETLDLDGDGTIDTTKWWAFDAGGREVTAGSKWGSESSTTTRTFDAGGFLLVEMTERTGDATRTSTFTRRTDGAPLTHRYQTGANVESTATWTYEANGTSTKRELSSIRTTTTIVDANGRVLEEREDQPKDGVDDYIRQFTYAAATGNILVRDHAFGRNGEEYGDLKQTLDPNGRVVETWKRWGFGQVNGPTTDVENRSYDACGQVVSIQRTQNGAQHSSVARTYDSRGYLLVEEQRRWLPQKMNPSKISRTFDAQGHVTQIVNEDLDATTNVWKVSLTETRAYDGAGHLVEVLKTSAATSTRAAKTRREAWTYDAKGDLVLHERTAQSAGAIVREEMDYACLY